MVSVLAAISLMVAIAVDLIAERRQQAESDPLSGLLNRRGFEAAATAALRRCDGERRPAALLIADLDHFKQVNDVRSEEHTSELQSLMRISYAVFCLKKKKHPTSNTSLHTQYVHLITNIYLCN